MNEKEVQAQMHPHTGQVEVQPADETQVAIALERTLRVLRAIAEGNDLPAAYAKNTLEDISALMRKDTYDHAGPDY